MVVTEKVYNQILEALNNTQEGQLDVNEFKKLYEIVVNEFSELNYNRKTEELNKVSNQYNLVSRVINNHISDRNLPYFYLGGISGMAKIVSVISADENVRNKYRNDYLQIKTKPILKKLLEIIASKFEIQHKDLARLAGIKSNYLSSLMPVLVDSGLVEKITLSKFSYYNITSEGKKYLYEMNKGYKVSTPDDLNYAMSKFVIELKKLSESKTTDLFKTGIESAIAGNIQENNKKDSPMEFINNKQELPRKAHINEYKRERGVL